MTHTLADGSFSGTTASKLVNITYRQLDYWARTDLVRPSLASAAGSGSRRLYSYQDLLELRIVRNLLEAGIKLEHVRAAFAYLRTNGAADISAAHLVISGSQVVLCEGDQLVDVLRNGQGVLNVLPLASIKHEVDAAIVALPPTVVASSGTGLRFASVG